MKLASQPSQGCNQCNPGVAWCARSAWCFEHKVEIFNAPHARVKYLLTGFYHNE